MQLDGGLRSTQLHGLLHRHDHFDVVSGIVVAAGDEPVHGGVLGHGADIGGDEHMKEAHALVSVDTLLAQPAVRLRDLHVFREEVQGIVALRHHVGDEQFKPGQGAEQTSVAAVAGPAAVVFV